MKVGQLVTPTGVLLSTTAPHTPEWFAVRAGGVTASEQPALLGMSSYATARHVYESKVGHLPPDPGGKAAKWGTLLEDVVARDWAAQRGLRLRRVGVIANVDRPHLRCSLDRLVVGRREALEAKCRNAFVSGQWREDIPDDVLAQVAMQRVITGLDRIHVAVLIGGNDDRSFTYERDTPVEDLVVERSERLWQQVLDRTPPTVDPSALLLDLLNRLYPDRSGDRDLTASAARVQAETALLQLHRDARLHAEKGEVEAKAALVELLGDGQVGLVGGQFAYAYPQRTRTVRAREASVSTYRQLTFTPPKETAA